MCTEMKCVDYRLFTFPLFLYQFYIVTFSYKMYTKNDKTFAFYETVHSLGRRLTPGCYIVIVEQK